MKPTTNLDMVGVAAHDKDLRVVLLQVQHHLLALHGLEAAAPAQGRLLEILLIRHNEDLLLAGQGARVGDCGAAARGAVAPLGPRAHQALHVWITADNFDLRVSCYMLYNFSFFVSAERTLRALEGHVESITAFRNDKKLLMPIGGGWLTFYNSFSVTGILIKRII